LPVGLAGAEVMPTQHAGGNQGDADDHQDGNGVGGTISRLCHAAGDCPGADDAERDGASAPGGGLDAEFRAGGGVGAGPGGAGVPVGQRGPGRLGGLEGVHFEAGGLKELVPVERRRGRRGLFDLRRDGLEGEQLTVRIGQQAQHPGLLEGRIAVVHGGSELVHRGQGLKALAVPELHQRRLARGRIAPARGSFLGMLREVRLVAAGILEPPGAVGGFGGVSEVAQVPAGIAREGIRRVFEIELRSDADAGIDNRASGDQHERRRQPGEGEFGWEAIRFSGSGHEFGGRRLTRRQRGGQGIAAGKARRHGPRRRGPLPGIGREAA